MSKISVTLDVVTNGKLISLVAPCESNVTTYLTINGIDYTICDAKNNNIGCTSGLWVIGATISFIINTETKKAYIQNTITPASIGAAPAYSYGTDDLTAGSSALETGKLHFVYE